MSIFMHMYFETQNLMVRQYAMNDIDGLYNIMSDSQVHQYSKDKNHPWDRIKTKQYIQFFMDSNFVTLDCFHGAVIEKASGNLIGLTGLNPYKKGEPEIEWKLGVAYWNKGYATEIGRELIKKRS